MKIPLWGLIVVFLFCLPLARAAQGGGSAGPAAQEESRLLAEKEAVDLLVGKVKGDALYDYWTTPDCLDFVIEETTDSHVDIAIRENHEGGCPGDPDTAPVVDRFRVVRATKEVLWYEFPEDEYVAYERGRAWRNK